MNKVNVTLKFLVKWLRCLLATRPISRSNHLRKTQLCVTFYQLFSSLCFFIFLVSEIIVHDDGLGFTNAYSRYRKVTAAATNVYFYFRDQCTGNLSPLRWHIVGRICMVESLPTPGSTILLP